MVMSDETDRSATSKKNNAGEHTNQIGALKARTVEPESGNI